MPFIEFEKSVKTNDWSMQELHSHAHYEIYFLSEGTRAFFLSDALYRVSAPTIVVIPPHTVHKTEGGPFTRFNINVAETYLNEYQRHVFQKSALHFFTPNETETQTLMHLFEEAAAVDRRQKYAEEVLLALFGYFTFTFGNLNNSRLQPNAEAANDLPPLVLKAMEYMNLHYAESLTLKTLSERFYLSQGAFSYTFKKHTNFSPIDYLLNVRLTKAKALLSGTRKSVAEIAELCGFSSANYFGLLFKKKEKLSPAAYRKIQRQKN